jgi:CheY-like chemotaxis protein
MVAKFGPKERLKKELRFFSQYLKLTYMENKTERTKLLPVVILRYSKEEQDIVNGYSFGVNSYVRKPVDFNQFAEVVSHLGLYWLLLNEIPPTK